MARAAVRGFAERDLQWSNWVLCVLFGIQRFEVFESIEIFKSFLVSFGCCAMSFSKVSLVAIRLLLVLPCIHGTDHKHSLLRYHALVLFHILVIEIRSGRSVWGSCLYRRWDSDSSTSS